MPYNVIMDAQGCDGHAVVKEGSTVAIDGGCHATHQEAVDHMTALNIATTDEYNQRNDEMVAFIDEAIITLMKAKSSYDTDDELEDEPEEIPELAESRAVDLSAPVFMRESARRGLELHEQGLSGDGLMPQTVADARKMSAGEIAEAKWRKIGAWIARHIDNLDAVDGNEITAGLVAMLLWGGGSTKTSARRTQAYADRIVQRLDSERGVDPSQDEQPASHADDSELQTDSRVDRDTTVDNGNTRDSDEVYTKSNMSETAQWVSGTLDERRSVAYTTLELREAGEGNVFTGYAALFDSPSEPMPFTEYVRRGAFSKTLNDGADVRLLIDHEGVPLARTRSGTLMLQEDDRGLRVEATLDPMNPDAQRVMSAMRRGDLSQMSFAFRTIKDNFSADGMVRELREVQLFDVSVVTYPAYEDTIAELRRVQPATVVPTGSLLARQRQIQIARHR